MPENRNQINHSLLSQIAAEQWEQDQELLAYERLERMENEFCRDCGYPITECNCSRYDSEGNEL